MLKNNSNEQFLILNYFTSKLKEAIFWDYICESQIYTNDWIFLFKKKTHTH